MQRRNIWQLYSSLSASEAKKFPLWLHLELGERQQYVQQLALYLSQHLSHAPSEEEVWRHLYPDLPYDDGRVRKLMRDLNRLLEEFIAVEAFRNDTDRLEMYLLEEIHRRNRPSLFVKTYKRLKKTLDGRPFRNASYFRKTYEMERVFQKYLIHYEPKKKYSRVKAFNKAFDGWWMHGKMELAFINATHFRSFGTIQEDVFLGEVLSYVEKSPEFLEMNVLNIYLKLYLLFTDDLRVDSETVRSLAQTHASEFSSSELRTIFGLLVNFQINKNRSNPSITNIQELLNLYIWGIEESLIFVDNVINIRHYKNILTTCLHLKEYEKARMYLEDLKENLSDEIRQEAYLFNLSKYLLETGDYPQVIEVLRNIRFTNPIFEIPVRTTLIQAHYELSGPGQEWLITTIESLIRYVRKQNIPAHHRKTYLNFLILTKKMIHILFPNQLERLLHKLDKTKPVYQEAWLRKKIKDRLLSKPA